IWLVQGSSGDGGVFFTSNGGVSWVQQFSGGNQNPNKIYMYNARIGFMSNSSALPNIYKTTNSGENWTVNLSGENFYHMQFIDSLTGWKSSTFSNLVDSSMKKTTNGGITWFKQYIPTGSDIIQFGISGFSCLNKDTVWAVGNSIFFPNSQVRGMVFRTINGGANWLYQIPDTVINTSVYYFIQFVNRNNGWAYNTSRGIHTATGGDPVWITALEQLSTEIPKEFKLFQNYPNPFNPNTRIEFQLLKRGNAEIIIYDITGRRIQKLLNEELSAGEYEIDFNASGLSSGTYFYKLIINSGKEVFTETKKMVLIK
ncbi:MAG: T9SS type A sorting domain-containing protein, partial [Ignavibacteria bacterium]|nr:T9SS type A sorting domain-containing protein [Ignavibacteria bacterium]